MRGNALFGFTVGRIFVEHRSLPHSPRPEVHALLEFGHGKGVRDVTFDVTLTCLKQRVHAVPSAHAAVDALEVEVRNTTSFIGTSGMEVPYTESTFTKPPMRVDRMVASAALRQANTRSRPVHRSPPGFSDHVVFLPEDKVSAELAGEIHAEAVVPIDGDDFGRAHGLGRIDGKQTDWAQPMNRHRRPFNRAPGQGVDGVPQRVLNGGVLWFQPFWNGPSVDRGDDEVRCKGPVAMHTEDAPVLAHVGVSFVAARASPTRQMALDRHHLTHMAVHHAWSNGCDFATCFVTCNRSKGDVFAAPVVPLPDVQIRSANAGGSGADQTSPSPGTGRGGPAVEAIGFVADFVHAIMVPAACTSEAWAHDP